MTEPDYEDTTIIPSLVRVYISHRMVKWTSPCEIPSHVGASPPIPYNKAYFGLGENAEGGNVQEVISRGRCPRENEYITQDLSRQVTGLSHKTSPDRSLVYHKGPLQPGHWSIT